MVGACYICGEAFNRANDTVFKIVCNTCFEFQDMLEEIVSTARFLETKCIPPDYLGLSKTRTRYAGICMDDAEHIAEIAEWEAENC